VVANPANTNQPPGADLLQHGGSPRQGPLGSRGFDRRTAPPAWIWQSCRAREWWSTPDFRGIGGQCREYPPHPSCRRLKECRSSRVVPLDSLPRWRGLSLRGPAKPVGAPDFPGLRRSGDRFGFRSEFRLLGQPGIPSKRIDEAGIQGSRFSVGGGHPRPSRLFGNRRQRTGNACPALPNPRWKRVAL